MAKPTHTDDKQESQNFVPQNMNLFVVFRGFATFYMFYLAYRSLNRYFTTPEDRPSVLFMVFSTVILAGGGLFILIVSVLQYRKYKAAEAAEKARVAQEAALKESQASSDEALPEAADEDAAVDVQEEEFPDNTQQ